MKMVLCDGLYEQPKQADGRVILWIYDAPPWVFCHKKILSGSKKWLLRKKSFLLMSFSAWVTESKHRYSPQTQNRKHKRRCGSPHHSLTQRSYALDGNVWLEPYFSQPNRQWFLADILRVCRKVSFPPWVSRAPQHGCERYHH